MIRTAPAPFRAMMRLFPRDFLVEYGLQMEGLFVQMLADRHDRRLARVTLWFRTLWDVLIQATLERAQGWRKGPAPRGSRPTSGGNGLNFLADLRFALRMIRRNPGYAAAFIITFALGIGANTAIFSVINGVLVQPLPHRDSGRIVSIEQPYEFSGVPTAGFSMVEVNEYRSEARTVTQIAEHFTWDFTLLGLEQPHKVTASAVSSNFFQVMGLQLQLGRSFTTGEDERSAAPALVLTNAYWRRAFGTDPDVIGREVDLDGTLYTVVGVMAQVPLFPAEVDIYVPAATLDHYWTDDMRSTRTHRMLAAVGRLGLGVNVEEANTEFAVISSRLYAAFPEAYPANDAYELTITPLRDKLIGSARPALYILMGTAAFVLVIACANVANLTLTRMIQREREIAVRTALGASHGRIRRQLFTENFLLSTIAAGLGVFLAARGLDVLVTFAERYTVRATEVSLDWTVLLFTLGVGTVAATAFTLLPGLTSSVSMSAALKEGARSTTDLRRRRVQRGLVVGQIAVSFILLIGAGLMMRTLINLYQVDPGFDPENVLAMDLDIPGNFQMAERAGFVDQLIEQLEAVPSVQSAAVAMRVPLRGQPMSHDMLIEGREFEAGADAPTADFRSVSSHYFQTVGVTLIRGRTFTGADRADAPGVVIVNKAFADFYFPGDDPIGRRFSWAMGQPQWTEIIGVVADTKDYGLDTEAVHAVFQHYAQASWGRSLLVRTTSDAGAVVGQVLDAIHVLLPNEPVEDVRTLQQIRSDSIAPRRLNATLFGVFALVALAIAATGIGGILAFSVSQRTQEIGIRLTLGADASKVLLMVMREGLALAVIGLAIGGAGAFWLSRFISGLLFDVAPTDAITFLGVALALAGVAAAASLLPALRATRVNPMEAVRVE